MGNFKQFVTCHCHQASLDTASTPEAFAERELELGSGYLTVTDHGTLNAARKVFDLAKKKKLTPIIGLEAYLRDDNCSILAKFGINPEHPLDKNGSPDTKKPKTLAHYAKYFHLTLAFQDQQAYETGVRILSDADARAEWHGSEKKPLFTWDQLEELGGQNVTMTSSCLIGVVQRHLLDHDNPEIAQAYYEKLRGICKPGNFYSELFPHDCSTNWEDACYVTFEDLTKVRFKSSKRISLKDSGQAEIKEFGRRWKAGKKDQLVAVMENRHWVDREPKTVIDIEVVEGFVANECRPWAEDGDVQKGCNQAILYFAEKYGDKILIGDDSHYAHADEKIVQDIRLQASGGSWRFSGHYHRQSSDEAFEHFQKTLNISEDEFKGWIDNTLEWGERFKGFSFKERKSLPTSFYPSDTLNHLMDLIEKQGRMRWDNPAWVDRLAQEIDMLHNNGKIDLLPYFFIDQEVVQLYAEHGELTGPGRGSAAGMLLAYLLRITHVDPIKRGLSMERFLTASRIRSGKLPDIDQDVGSRDILVGGDSAPGFEVTMEDGSKRQVEQLTMVQTPEGVVTVKEAFERGLEVKSWL